LSDPELLEIDVSGSILNQIIFSLLGISMVTALLRVGLSRLRPIATVPIVACAAWLFVTIFFSVEPLLSFRRIILLSITAVIAVGVLFVARDFRQLALTLGGVALVVLTVSYAAALLTPGLAIHTPYDVLEPQLAGLWRGIFLHKNEAGPAMAIFILIGLAIFSQFDRVLGACIVISAGVFLVLTGCKTYLILLPVTLFLTSMCRIVTSLPARAILLLSPLVIAAVVSLGSVLFPSVRDALLAAMPDSTFTGRSEIWEFAIEKMMERPIVGWGYGAFWGTETTVLSGGGLPGDESSVSAAKHAHNAFLDTSIAMGFPGLVLAVAVFVVSPIRDFQRIAPGRDIEPAVMFFMRVWLLGLCASSFESVLFNANSSVWPVLLMAVLGLKFRASYALADGGR
jgi:O-antigen ligase